MGAAVVNVNLPFKVPGQLSQRNRIIARSEDQKTHRRRYRFRENLISAVREMRAGVRS